MDIVNLLLKYFGDFVGTRVLLILVMFVAAIAMLYRYDKSTYSGKGKYRIGVFIDRCSRGLLTIFLFLTIALLINSIYEKQTIGDRGDQIPSETLEPLETSEPTSSQWLTSSPTLLPTPTPYPELSRGSTGFNVYKLQERLKELNYYTEQLDDVYGPGTQSAVSAFQQNNGLLVNGIADNATQERLHSSSAIPAPPKPLPKSLTAFDPILKHSWYPNSGSLVDSLGTRYTSNIQYIITDYDESMFYPHNRDGWFYAELHINGEYTKLKGKIAAHESMTQNGSGSIRILIDKGTTGQWEEIYPKGELRVTRKTDPFDIDITLGEAIKYVRIEASGDCLLLLDFIFYN